MPRYFQCDDAYTVTAHPSFSVYVGCGLPETGNNINHWVEIFEPPSASEDITTILASISEFDAAQVAQFTAIYLVFFIIGYTVGNISLLMKKA
jgi:hypothetical protein